MLQKAEANFVEATQTITLLRERFTTELKELNKVPKAQHSTAQEDELHLLRKKLQEITEMNARLVDRANTISSRYKTGDLVSSSGRCRYERIS
jgi:hypothetical protein